MTVFIPGCAAPGSIRDDQNNDQNGDIYFQPVAENSGNPFLKGGS
jgi:hypothetical protein